MKCLTTLFASHVPSLPMFDNHSMVVIYTYTTIKDLTGLSLRQMGQRKKIQSVFIFTCNHRVCGCLYPSRNRQYGTQRLCVPSQLELKDWPQLFLTRRNIPLIYNMTRTIIQFYYLLIGLNSRSYVGTPSRNKYSKQKNWTWAQKFVNMYNF